MTAAITVSVDGYVAGPHDGPGKGLGDGGERLHYWVFGGPWTYDDETFGDATGEDKAWLDEAMRDLGAVVAGRWTYESGEKWGGHNPWPVPLFVVTHEPDPDAAPDSGFTFVNGVAAAIEQAVAAAGDKDVQVMGGADVIRQALAGGHVDRLTLIVAPVILGAGKRLFDGFEQSIDLEHVGVRQSPHATFIDYRIVS